MVKLLIVRHGQSEWNADGRWQGHADPALSELGRAQARAAADALGTVDAIVASDLRRAHDTALIISEALGVGPVVIDPGLRERDIGEWQGLTRDDIERDWPDHLGFDRYPPGWESHRSLTTRALAAIERAVEMMGGGSGDEGQVLVVAHGGIIYALERHLEVPFARIANLHGRWIHHDGHEIRLGDRIALTGDDVPVTTPDER